jgi:hypothetical protein
VQQFDSLESFSSATLPVNAMDKTVFESICQELVGQEIIKATYYELDYGTDSYWNDDPRFHSLDFGLDLETKQGNCFGITWGKEFAHYGVSVKKESLKHSLGDVKSFSATETIQWQKIIKRKIVDVKVTWSWVQTPPAEKIPYPQDLIFEFDNQQQMFVSNLEISRDGSFWGGMNHITVFFDKAVAEQFYIGIGEH